MGKGMGMKNDKSNMKQKGGKKTGASAGAESAPMPMKGTGKMGKPGKGSKSSGKAC